MTNVIAASLIKFIKKVDKSYTLTFETSNEYKNDGALDDLHMRPIWLTLSESPLSEESQKVIESTPIEEPTEKYSASQKLRFAVYGLHARLKSDTDREAFYQATIQTYIDQLNKQAI